MCHSVHLPLLYDEQFSEIFKALHCHRCSAVPYSVHLLLYCCCIMSSFWGFLFRGLVNPHFFVVFLFSCCNWQIKETESQPIVHHVCFLPRSIFYPETKKWRYQLFCARREFFPPGGWISRFHGNPFFKLAFFSLPLLGLTLLVDPGGGRGGGFNLRKGTNRPSYPAPDFFEFCFSKFSEKSTGVDCSPSDSSGTTS